MLLSPVKSWHSSDIKFYHQHERYYEFTNFSLYPVQLDGKQWPTTEHYFQAQKFVGTPYAEAIRKQPNARRAFDMSRNPKVSRWRRGDWDQVKDDIMLKCLRAKFTQHRDLREMLLDTGERNLIEHTPNDSYWGDGGDGSGQNKLGKLLMQVRKELSDQAHEHQGKFTCRLSSDDGSVGKKGHEKKKHRRHNSISGITATIPGSQPTLISSKRKFRSTENLHFPSNSLEQSSSHTLERINRPNDGLHASDSQTHYKPTIVRSSSYGDLHRRSFSSDLRRTTQKCTPRINRSCVTYNIISNQ